MSLNFLNNDQGLLGLPNVGNSCYLNSTIQCLAGTPDLLKYFFQSVKLDNGDIIKRYKIDMAQVKNIKNNKTKSKQYLIENWFNLLNQLWASKSQINRVNPVPFYRAIGQVAKESNTAISITGDQNDFQEFLILLMDSLHDGLSRETTMNVVGNDLTDMDKLGRQSYNNFIKHFEKDYSIFVKLFNGQINTKTIGECGHESNIFDPFKFFNLIVPQSKEPIKLEDLFSNYISDTYLKEHSNTNGDIIDERWYCDKCKNKVNAVTKNLIWDLPQYLIISLGRYQYFPRQMKINTQIIYPLENLDMSQFHSGFKNNSMKYNLYAVSNHFGGQHGGHYTAYRKNPDGKWYSFDDESVEEITNPEKEIINNGAYCLFYQRNE